MVWECWRVEDVGEGREGEVLGEQLGGGVGWEFENGGRDPVGC